LDVTVLKNQAPTLHNCTDFSLPTLPGQAIGTVVLTVFATDKDGAALEAVCSPTSGSFPLGETEVRCSARDAEAREG
jgi:hypothetical protein